MTRPEYRDWLFSLIPYYTDEQVAVCSLFFPEEDLETRLLDYMDRLIPSTLSVIFNSLSTRSQVDQFLSPLLSEIRMRADNLRDRFVRFRNQAIRIKIGQFDDNPRVIDSLITEGEQLKSEIRALAINKLRHYIRTLPDYTDTYHSCFQFADEQQIVIAKLCDTLRRLIPQDNEEDEYDEWAIESTTLIMLNLSTLELLNLHSYEDLKLYGLGEQAAFDKLGISKRHIDGINEIKGMINAMAVPNQAIDQAWQHLLHTSNITDEHNLTNLLENLYRALNLDSFGLDKREALITIFETMLQYYPRAKVSIQNNLKILRETNKKRIIAALTKNCISFVRKQQFNYVLYHHIQKKRNANVDSQSKIDEVD